MLDEFLIVETNDMDINENGFDALKISPNPSNGVFTVTSNTSDIKTIEVVNILGEVIDTRAVNGSINETFDMTSFSAGMYFVKSSHNKGDEDASFDLFEQTRKSSVRYPQLTFPIPSNFWL